MQELPYETMQTLLGQYPDFNKTFLSFRFGVIKSGKTMPLDYIMNLPKQIMKKITRETKAKISVSKKDEIDAAIAARKKEMNKLGKILEPDERLAIEENLVTAQEVDEYQAKAFLLENNLKNFVIRKLDDIREKKNSKSIKEGVVALRKKAAEKEQKARTKIRKMILRKYEEETARQGIEDPNLEAQKIILDTIDERQQAIDDQEKLGAKEFDPLY